MQFTVSPLLTAPQVSGHPQGLPEVRPPNADPAKITPIADSRNPEAGLKDGKAPTKFWRAVNGEPDPATHAAPPSIMQITISQMLDEQSPDNRGDTAADTAPDQVSGGKDARSSVFSTLP
ncbi:hypothetical protein KUW09_22055 [Mameliella alba]|nr:hypothetical protein [Antarctobacter heliothermus]MBY6146751.1 hypothetical protein [Mameliella alba]MBY6160778.1 hypothetical protein [Mameliella alba]MBY6169248.1 hypothetical protein [Mameliella alba]MBY6173531.1 hypothetical protein [Mameliella alba]